MLEGSINGSAYRWQPDQRETWMDDALCAQTSAEAFFPDKGGSTRDAKKLCGACDVRRQCFEFAMREDERFGIWGGLSERERRAVRKGRAPWPTFPAREVPAPVPVVAVTPAAPGARNGWTVSNDERLQRLVREGASDRQIAKAMHLELTTVAYRRKKAGLARNAEKPVTKVGPTAKRHVAWTKDDTARVAELHGAGMTDAQMAVVMGRSVPVIWKHRKKLGLPSHGTVGRPRKTPAA